LRRFTSFTAVSTAKRVDRRILHDPSTHDHTSVSRCRRHWLLQGNENRRSQSQASTGSLCLRPLQSRARMPQGHAATGPGTRLWDIPGFTGMGSGPAARATRPEPKHPERLPCRLPVVCIDVDRPMTVVRGRREAGRAAKPRWNSAARNSRNNPPERITPCLLATALTPETLGNRSLTHHSNASSSLGSTPILGGSWLALLH